MTEKQLENKLNNLKQSELIDLIIEFYNKDKENKELIDLKFDPSLDEDIFEKYKKQIINEFYPERGNPKLRYNVLKDAIKNYKDVSKNKNRIAELMLIYVENGVNFTCDYGDIDEKFYNNIINMYDSFIKYASENNILELFKERCFKFIDLIKWIGWGFHDELESMYYEYFKY